MADKHTAGSAELNTRDLSKFWLYMGIIVLCVAAMLYMLLSAKPTVSPAVKNNSSGASSRLVRPAALPSAAILTC